MRPALCMAEANHGTPSQRGVMRREDLLVLGIIHLLIRYWSARRGLRFDYSPPRYFWQFLDPAWLHDYPLESLGALHSQPPAFNGLLALLSNDVDSLRWVLFLFGATIPFAIYAVSRRWGAGRAGALLAATTWSALPASLLYENWLFYTIPVAALLMMAVLAVSWASASRRLLPFVALGALVALLCWTRSAFHLVWALALLSWVARRRGRRVYLTVAIFVRVAAAPSLHNLYRFGFFGTSSWMGMSLAKMAIPLDDREAVARLRTANPAFWLAAIPPFSPIVQYGAEHAEAADGEPAMLSAPFQTNRYPNMNHIGYLQISAAYRACSWTAIADDPSYYASKLRAAATLFFSPPSQYWFLTRNARPIAGYVEGFRSAAPAPIWLALLILAAWVVTLRARPRADDSVTVAFITCAYYFAVTSALEWGENQRFAVTLWPLFLVAFAVSGQRVVLLAGRVARCTRRGSSVESDSKAQPSE